MSEWILDVDRRPEEPGDVLVTVPSQLNPKRRIVAVMWYSPDLALNDETFAEYRGMGGYVYRDGKGRKKICKDVIAWMPLPEPYDFDEKKEGVEDEKIHQRVQRQA